MKLSILTRAVAALMLVFTATLVLAGENLNQRPFWGTAAGEVTFPSSEACLGVTGVPYQTVTFTEGKFTHLGRAELFTAHCSTADGGAAVGGVATLTAANGDEVWVTYTAITVAPPPDIIQEADLIIVGGTGRFEGASGILTGMVYVTLEGYEGPSPIRFVVAGWIVY